MSGAAPGKASVSAAMSASARPRRKVLSAEEAELFELAQAAGSGLDPEVFKVLLDLLRMNVAPLAVFQVLKSMCAGQRLPAGPDSAPPAAPPADSRGRGRAAGPPLSVSPAEPPEDAPAFSFALRPPRFAHPSPRCLSAPPAARPAPGPPLGAPAAAPQGRGFGAARRGLRLPARGAAPRGARGARSV
ncbi:mitotic-spindle organizing protein 2-like isoform X1 [Phasianus colchicus]|uniref:mitotic-spindle organizing protein 2-like isoform X1 n=1 Tax=Phasianus colchicus TaxID=9054 RepID=UPI00129EC921|nr:mitotic-spindle organizing protein 2-like isoform X1 [Phasianus colchicus]